MDPGDAKKQDAKRYAMNVNAGGKVHRLVPKTGRRWEDKRTLCGWRAGAAVAKAMSCKSIAAGALCRKCFREVNMLPLSIESEDDAIEDTE